MLAHQSRAADLDDLLDALSSSDDLLTLLGALHLAPRFAHVAEPKRSTLYHSLQDHIHDDRVHIWSWGEASYQHKRFEVATLAAEAAVRIIEHEVRAQRSTDLLAPTPPRAPSPPLELGARLAELLRLSLNNPAGAGPVRAVFNAFRQLAYNRDDKEAIATQLARCMGDTANSREHVAVLREQATLELDKAIRANPLGTRAAFEAERDRVVSALIDSLNDDTEDFHFQRRARPLLMKLAPSRVEALQASGTLETVPLPAARDLLNGWGSPSDERARAMAALVTVDTVTHALNSDDPEAIISAACVVPLMSPPVPWRELAQLLRRAIAHPGHIERRDPQGRVHRIQVGAIASDRLLKLLAPHIRQEQPEAAQLFLDGLDQLLNNTPLQGRLTQEPIRRYLREIRWLRGSLQAALQDRLIAYARDPSRSPSSRFAALLADRRPEADAYAWELLTSPDAPAGLRVLIGSHVHTWCPDRVTALVDASEHRWPLLPGSDPDLPICEPGRKVPLDWLIAALRGSEHRHITFSTVRNLGARFNRTSDTPDTAQLRDRLLRRIDPPLLNTLRDVLDAPTEHDPPYWSAAVCLALAGHIEDEDRLVHFAVEHGAWTRIDPTSDAFLDTNLLDHLVLRPLQYPDPHHMLEPYLLAGFGPEHTRRLVAKVFVGLSHQARRDGLVQSARRACRLASQLDPLNLAARRGERL
ncbi:MAG: hypothetical protein CMH57_12430 [Myxococcales bacterium]|nr:hypothetical protein [Myxococcales bacterium]